MSTAGDIYKDARIRTKACPFLIAIADEARMIYPKCHYPF